MSTPQVSRTVGLVATLVLSALAGCQPASEDLAATDSKTRNVKPSFPGSAPWEKVPRDRVAKECGLDPALLEAAEPQLGQVPYAIVRYGKMCWSGGNVDEVFGIASVTKTVVSALFGLVAGRTDVDENSYVRDWVSVTDQSVDAIATALTRPPANPDAKIFNVLTITGHNPVLTYGMRLPWVYDAAGAWGMNSIVKLMDNVVLANPEAFPGSSSANDVAMKELFAPLGMTSTTWDGVVAAHTMYSTVYDLAKLGELLLRKGRWGDRQLIDEDYVYRMTHPQIEDIQTHYGYLTWLNVAAGQASDNGDTSDLVCSPFAGWPRYPHPPMLDAPDDRGAAPFRNGHDVGVFWAQGAGGHYIIVHRGLDMVIVVRDNDQVDGKIHRVWHQMRPALVALDPVYKGDEAAFCDAYRRGEHAPSLLSPWDAESGFGSVRLDRS